MTTPLKKERDYRRLAQTVVAEAIGMTQSHLAKLEKGLVAASPDTANKLAKYLGPPITRDHILFPDDYPDYVAGGLVRKPIQPTQLAQVG